MFLTVEASRLKPVVGLGRLHGSLGYGKSLDDIIKLMCQKTYGYQDERLTDSHLDLPHMTRI